MPPSRKYERNREYLRSITPLYFDYLDGVTGKLDEDGLPLPNASEGLTRGLTWVQLDGSREGAAVLNGVVNPYSPGIPVQTAVDRRTGKRQVVDIRFDEAVRLYGQDVARRMAVPLPMLFDSDELLIGKVEPADGLQIYVRRFVHDDTEFPGGYYDLTTIIGGMTASTQEMVLVGVNESTNAITVTEGAERSLAYPFTQADVDAITLPAGTIPLAGLVIRADQTDSADSFVPYVRWFDRREFLVNATGFVTLAPDSATRNTIQPTGDYPALTLKGGSGQTTALVLGSAASDNNWVDANIPYTDPSAAKVGVSLVTTVAQTVDISVAVFGVLAQVTKDTAGHNSTSATGMTAFRANINITGSGGTETLAVGVQVQPTVTGGVTLTTLRGFSIGTPTVSGGSVVTNSVSLRLAVQNVATNNTYLLAGQSAQAAGNWFIYSVSTYDSSIAGKLGLGANFTPTNDLSFGGETGRTVWIERRTTSNTAGSSLTVQAGGATSGATNKAGGDLVLQTGTNTGNVAPAHIRLLTGVMNPTSGTGDNSNVDRLRVGVTKVLTDNSAITIVNATLASNTMIGGIISYSIQVFDGTDVQTETGQAIYSGVNKAGAFTCSITEVNSQQDLSAGTLTTTWAITGANPAAISVNANSSLSPSTGYPRITYNIQNFAQQSIAIA